MKNFLSKKSSMLTLLILAVAFLAIYIVMLARPVSYGWGYTATEKEEVAGQTETTKTRLTIWSDKTATVKETTKSGEEETKIEVDAWIYRDGDKVAQLGISEYKAFVVTGKQLTEEELKAWNENKDLIMDEKEYEEEVKSLEDTKKDSADLYNARFSYKGNAFKMTVGEGEDAEEYTCRGAIAFAIVGGIVELVLVAGAAMAVVNNLKK